MALAQRRILISAAVLFAYLVGNEIQFACMNVEFAPTFRTGNGIPTIGTSSSRLALFTEMRASCLKLSGTPNFSLRPIRSILRSGLS
jgi:hypothetical protein